MLALRQVSGQQLICQKLSCSQSDPFKTLFVGRISYEATEKKLRREFEEFGVIKSVRMVHDKNSGACSSSFSYCGILIIYA